MNKFENLPFPLRQLPDDHTLIMAILNVTPDSFSDGGQWDDTHSALRHAHDLVAAGADLIDVGGESTRPGSTRLDAATEIDRVLPVVKALSEEGVVVSVDTIHAETAQAVIAAGAAIINDVSGGLADPQMYQVVAQAPQVAYVCQHWRGTPETMDTLTDYQGDVTGGVLAELRQRVQDASASGIDPNRIILDPGLGFAKTSQQSWELLANLERFIQTGHPILVGASRKRFLASLASADPSVPNPAQSRDSATAAVSALSAWHGAWAVRVHQVRANLDAVRVAAAWKEQR